MFLPSIHSLTYKLELTYESDDFTLKNIYTSLLEIPSLVFLLTLTPPTKQLKALTVSSASRLLLRHGEPWGTGAGGARLPHALPPGVPRVPARDDEALLEEGSGWEAHFRVPPVLPGGLFHRHRATVPTWREPIACLEFAVYPSAMKRTFLKTGRRHES